LADKTISSHSLKSLARWQWVISYGISTLLIIMHYESDKPQKTEILGILRKIKHRVHKYL